MSFLVLLTYGSYKMIKLSNLEDYKVGMYILEDHYASTATFGSADGFTIAAAITSYDGSNEDITDPEIGEIKFYLKQWDVDEPNFDLRFVELENKVCQPEDFNFGNVTDEANVSTFYPVKELSESDLKSYGPRKMRCIKNLDELKIWGDYDTNKASNLMVVFEKCDILKRPPGQKCKSETEIEEWMAFKYIVTLENERKFISHKFGGSRIDEKSTIRLYPVNYKSRLDVVKKIYRAEVDLSDKAFNVAGLRDEHETAYFLESGNSNRLLPYKNTI